MTKTASNIRFRAKLFRPAATEKAGSWTFLTLPNDASAQLSSRGVTQIELDVWAFNDDARQAFISLGFRSVKETMKLLVTGSL